MSTALQILEKYWGHNQFRPLQEGIIDAVLAKKDVLALLPTGGGKSICFQVPALLKDGMCLVISPLIALMQDQVSNLQEKGIDAAVIHSGMPYMAVKETLQAATSGAYKFLYLSPERIESNLFKEYLPALDISLIAVDEAHCIAQWGYDFRPPYLRIAALRNELPGVPVIALTASATKDVETAIIEKLAFKNPLIFRQPYKRPALSYSYFEVESKINKTIEIINNVKGSGIVYCNTRKQTKDIAELLQLQKINADYYHAGVSADERQQKQKKWMIGETRIMVCTSAFGMGIDKDDVRTVIHYDMPDCLENYYQEAGRAGRDGKKAYAVLLATKADITKARNLHETRFPAISIIKSIYQYLANYLQLPVGIGEGGYYDFNLLEFCNNFKLDLAVVTQTLKVLEQEGHIQFSENIFLPTQVCFTCSKESLENFEEAYPAFEPLIKALLRSYQGIFDNRISIFEKRMAGICKQSIEAVQNQLQQLAAMGIIEYLPQKETPQIHFLVNRAPAAFLHIDQDLYLSKKEAFTTRINTLINFAINPGCCRSVFIGNYFGDTDKSTCGICDYCLAQKKTKLESAAFTSIEQQLYASLTRSPSPIDQLLITLGKDKEEEIWEVIRFLESENRLILKEDGTIQLV
ncbi:MAG: RecQ family ATP-dependent DNA helicase [Bacteroidetes bacterium]|nr:RecQ family ATP-dependent DNA helicase [Bacteroidota bacterium]